MSERPGLSVVVPTRDRPEHLQACLTALRADLGPDDELLVVDSASSVPVPGALRCDLPGASRARNVGWRAARHALVAFVDDDVQVRPGWADALVSALADAPFVTGRVVVPAGQEERERPVALTTLTSSGTLALDSRGTLGASANLGAHREALKAVGGFDERLGPGTWTRAAEDLDLFDRLLTRGPGWFAYEAAAEHDQWRSRRQLLALDHGYGIGLGVRLSLLLRRDRARFRQVVSDAVWDGTVTPGTKDLRAGYRFGVLLATVRLSGVVRGFLLGAVRLRAS